jgi:hypothetical protein
VNEPIERYPLHWPVGWHRTKADQRRRAHFGTRVSGFGTRPLSVFEAARRLTLEADRLGAAHAILSTNIKLRLDGLPRSDDSPPLDPGAALYFELPDDRGAQRPHVLASDRWDRVADNIAAIAAHIAAIRAVDRYGVGSLAQAFAGYTALAPTAHDWWLILELGRDATLDEVEDAYKRLARTHHPDRGGDAAAMARLSEARQFARATITGRS